MIYKIYQAQADLMYPARQLARFGAGMARAMDIGSYTPSSLRQFGAACTMLADGGLTHHRPDYGFRSTKMGNDVVGVSRRQAAKRNIMDVVFGECLPDITLIAVV